MTDNSTAPALPSTADPTPYVPVSWMAVAAMLVSGLFAVVLLGLAISAFISKRPLIMMQLLVFPVIGVVLSFAARRMIRNAEGTRTGEKLANAAWWTSLVAGLGYAAYLFAIDLSIKQDAQGEAQRWTEFVVKGEWDRAFLRTVEPARRPGLRPDPVKLQAEFPDPYLAFSQCDLIQLVQRNRGDCTITLGGMKDKVYKPTGIDCIIGAELKCPEGKFGLNIALRGTEGITGAEGGTRQWMIVPPRNGFVARDQIALTPYGWAVSDLHYSGAQYGKQVLDTIEKSGTWVHPLVYHEQIADTAKLPFWTALGQTTPARVAVAGGIANLAPFYTADYTHYIRNEFFRLPGGGKPSNEQQMIFADSWNTYGLVRPGSRLKNSPDTNERVVITDRAVEVHVPCELPFKSTEMSNVAARCRLVVTSSDPALLAELRQLRAAADPNQASVTPPDNFRKRDFRWRVARLETDLQRVEASLRPIPGSPGDIP